MSTLAKRRITEDDHARFANFSGDLNPLHVDPEASKRMLPGQRLAYGMDLLLWSLETLAAQTKLLEQLARVRVRFPKWVFLEDEVALSRTATASANTYELTANSHIVAVLELFPGERNVAPTLSCPGAPLDRRTEALALHLEQMVGREAFVPVADSAQALEMFPALSEQRGVQFVRECATCSYIIGMEAPGLYSMSMRYDLQLHASPQPSPCMHYKCITADERFRKIRVAAQGLAISASLEALVREA